MAAQAPSIESARAAWAAAEEEEQFWLEHYEDYLKDYPDQFVAVYRGQVLATSPDLRHLVGIIQGKGLEPRRTWVRHIAATPRHLAL